MSTFKLLYQVFVKRFYKENAGTFVFVFTIMFCIISKVDGAGLYTYHYLLAAGMLKSSIFLLLVFLLWLLYVRKLVVYISDTITNPYYSFLQIYNNLSKRRRLLLFFSIEVLLLLPILLYDLFICFVGLQQKLYLPAGLTILYLMFLCITAAVWHVYQLDNLNKKIVIRHPSLSKKIKLSSYQFTLIRFVINKQINIWIAIKLFTCGLLYLIARNNTAAEPDLSLAFSFYSFGILANGVLIFRVRTFEETHLCFYKSLPVSITKRFLQYSLFYFLLLIPEFTTILNLAPAHLSIKDAIGFILCGFSLVLLMNSLTFLRNFKMKDYIAILLATFFVEYIFLITAGATFLYVAFFALAIMLFFNNYYKLETLPYV